ncbi:hypothetical protein SDC9_126020 [bioreactor metagenome]|uniref:Uncharacterized protein n=1 Tax=bioreactor metagenome TaxID=1076179 RepID=A0A645CQ47_9ZZZZ
MDNKTALLKPFSIWARETQELHPEIISHWMNSNDPFRRAMAKTILEASGGLKLWE